MCPKSHLSVVISFFFFPCGYKYIGPGFPGYDRNMPLTLPHMTSGRRTAVFLFGHGSASDDKDEWTEHEDFGSYGSSGSSLWPQNLSQT